MKKHRVSTVVLAAVAMFAIAGGATAASKYIITSTHQIKPSVLNQLRTNLMFGDVKGVVATMCAAGSDTTGRCEVASSDARCPGGAAMGGGFDGGVSPPMGASMGYNEPDSDGHGWHIIMGNSNIASAATFQAVVVCVGTSHAVRDARAGAPPSVRAQISHELAAMQTIR